MDWLVAVFQWLMVNQPPFPWSLIWGGIAFVLTMSFVHGVREDDEDWTFGPILISFFYALFIGGFGGGIVARNGPYYWYHWISMLVGWVVVPTLLGSAYWLVSRTWRTLRAGGDAIARSVRALRQRWAQWRERTAAEDAKRRAAEEISPERVLARCRVIVEEFKAQLPKDIGAIEEMRKAGDLLEALEELYKLDANLERLSPGDTAVLDEKVRAADALFARVSLEKHCPELIASLRSERRAVGPVREHIHAAIEALDLLIMTLPDRVGGKLALQVPHEYQQVVDDLRQPNGVSLLPELAPVPVAEPVREEAPAPLRQAKRQTA